jgi:hypothetical protein
LQPDKAPLQGLLCLSRPSGQALIVVIVGPQGFGCGLDKQTGQ